MEQFKRLSTQKLIQAALKMNQLHQQDKLTVSNINSFDGIFERFLQDFTAISDKLKIQDENLLCQQLRQQVNIQSCTFDRLQSDKRSLSTQKQELEHKLEYQQQQLQDATEQLQNARHMYCESQAHQAQKKSKENLRFTEFNNEISNLQAKQIYYQEQTLLINENTLLDTEKLQFQLENLQQTNKSLISNLQQLKQLNQSKITNNRQLLTHKLDLATSELEQIRISKTNSFNNFIPEQNENIKLKTNLENLKVIYKQTKTHYKNKLQNEINKINVEINKAMCSTPRVINGNLFNLQMEENASVNIFENQINILNQYLTKNKFDCCIQYLETQFVNQKIQNTIAERKRIQKEINRLQNILDTNNMKEAEIIVQKNALKHQKDQILHLKQKISSQKAFNYQMIHVHTQKGYEDILPNNYAQQIHLAQIESIKFEPTQQQIVKMNGKRPKSSYK
ncbi:Hypothetical_protein [Hexamita inflata]|uniref:Hypothetical_protein n=1 Tax=Hexamita inflata TaxID=28002 RepID=A0ABP1JVC0_9EUKA